MMTQKRPPSPRLTEKERSYRAIFEEAGARGVPPAQIAVEKDIAAVPLSWWKGEIRRRQALRRGVQVKRKNLRPEESVELVPDELASEEDRASAPTCVLQETPREGGHIGDSR